MYFLYYVCIRIKWNTNKNNNIMTLAELQNQIQASNESYSQNRKIYLNTFIGKKFIHKGITYTIEGVTDNNENFIFNGVDELNARTILNYFYN